MSRIAPRRGVRRIVPAPTAVPPLRRVGGALDLGENPPVSASTSRVSYSEVEIRSYLPSGWSIAPGASGRWDAARGAWSIDVSDGADNVWTVSVPATAAANDRLGAFKAEIGRLERKALGRKSVITG